MPSKTLKQKKAMRAAAAGKGKIGIPKKVGKKYAKEDAKKSKGKK